MDDQEPSQIFPILSIIPFTAPVGHFGTAWSKPFVDAEKGKYKIALTVIGVLFLIFAILMTALPFIVITSVVSDSVVTSSEITQGFSGVVMGELVCAAGGFACWVAGIILSWQAYNATKALYHSAKHL